MKEPDFLRSGAAECRRLACRSANDWVRRQLLQWAGRFDAIADDVSAPEYADPVGATKNRRHREREAAD